MTVIDPEQFTDKSKPITYIRAFIKLYNWRNNEQVHKMREMVKFEKMHAYIAKLPRNLSSYHIIKISSILHNAHIIAKGQERIVFYVNNYMNWDQFYQLYALDWLEKGV